MVKKSLEDRFYSRIVAGPNNCWVWSGANVGGGYGQICNGGRVLLATHVALHLSNRPRPGNLFALHSCDNPRCVNPDHLRWGTPADNMADAVARNRFAANKSRAHLKRDVCLRGHDRTTPGAILPNNSCRVCAVEQNRRYRAERETRAIRRHEA